MIDSPKISNQKLTYNFKVKIQPGDGKMIDPPILPANFETLRNAVIGNKV